MRPLLCALAGLSLLRAAGADAAPEPFIPSRGDSTRSTGCDTHMAVHGRLDVIEETVEKTVEHLEAEVKGLLSQLEELAWNLPPGPFSPTSDLLGDAQHQVRVPGRAGPAYEPNTEQMTPSLAIFIPPSSSVPLISLPRNTTVPRLASL
ncbi:placenta-specific protein 9 isoform X1 [Rhinolophus sinicus]|uniref:placenta-specific protein 9 isoform X1 n=2 Tax=Rhinolophus sinicus TaxID=89399 RepID=UPI0009437261|nr:PREDICTED: placenta-specific protein 9 isoform X2 [Rhinolophus sinicus]